MNRLEIIWVRCLLWIDVSWLMFELFRLRGWGPLPWVLFRWTFLDPNSIEFSNPWRLVGIGAKKAPTFEEATCYSLGLAPQFGSCCEFLLFCLLKKPTRATHATGKFSCRHLSIFLNWGYVSGFMWFPYVCAWGDVKHIGSHRYPFS